MKLRGLLESGAAPSTSGGSSGLSRDMAKAPSTLAMPEETSTTSLGIGCSTAGIETSVARLLHERGLPKI